MTKWTNILLLSLFFFSACRTNKHAITQNSQSSGREHSFIFQNDIQTANFNRLKVNANIQGNLLSTNASIKIIRDSVIQISIQPALGIEVAQINLRPKEIIVLNKINALYFLSNYELLNKKYNLMLDYYSLQGILLNEAFIPNEAGITQVKIDSSYTQVPFPDGTMLKSKANKVSLPTDFIVNKKQKINHTSITMPLALVSCRYNDFEKKADILFPTIYRISIMEGPKYKKADISIQSVSFNKSVKINLSNLSNYKQVDTFEQLIP